MHSELPSIRRHDCQLQPKPGALSCICFRAYNPFPKRLSESALDEDIMHFCARPSCRRWYHRECLLARGYVDPPNHPYPGDHGLRRVAVDPDESVQCALLAWYCEPVEVSDPENSMSTDASTLCTALDNMGISVTHLPPALVRIAQFPIVRRPGPHHLCWRAVGNVAEVVLARRFLYAAFEGLFPGGHRYSGMDELVKRAEELERRLQLDESEMLVDAEDQPGNREDILVEDLTQLCTILGEYSLLASPYLPYWEAREPSLDEEVEAMAAPPLLCPNEECGNAI